jgi:heterodisulfide reductase subunit C
MDLTLGEMLRMASSDNPEVFSTQTLWNCDAVLEDHDRCQEGINLVRVIEVLRDEAKLRGYSNRNNVRKQDSKA